MLWYGDSDCCASFPVSQTDYEWRCSLPPDSILSCAEKCDDGKVTADEVVLWMMAAFAVVLICTLVFCRMFKTRYPGLTDSPKITNGQVSNQFQISKKSAPSDQSP